MANCERDGHVWNAAGHCIFCKVPKVKERIEAPTGLKSCPFCGSFKVKLFPAGEDGGEYAQCQDCSACGPDHKENRHWNNSLPRLPPEGCYCPPDKCMAPVIMGRQSPCLRRHPTVTREQQP